MKGVTLAQRNRTAAEERRELILDKLRYSTDSIHVEDLSRTFGVSVATIRRDLDSLGRNGLITRTYGGAVLGHPRTEQTLREREISNAAGKDAIAREAAALVPPGATVLLDAGTTTGRLSHYLARIPQLTVFTNGLNALNVLVESELDIQVVALGGVLRHTNQALVGPLAETMVRNVYADFAFLGTDCLDVERGFSSRTLEQNSLKQLMVAQARHTVIVADSSKLNTTWSTYWTALPSACQILTDADADEQALSPFRSADKLYLTVCPLSRLSEDQKVVT
ncbi:DeoR/GlpR family DNA-binding transcription regulator [Nesterenkonia sphaerica]|uniref:DeoR/GlpR transcriptional regulator n=1 Tax=Nesterenkonia sphaerica TaxID=1804988 RepID=A0A5R9AI39_9MICC|nr:DeoR/GlpR family DNA-binding transcription regulator [Nesterenkonia sphaerica]TLP77516.1 DeoR/GlpR transcriptional regulator [Nesterenkonia sphaerica]